MKKVVIIFSFIFAMLMVSSLSLQAGTTLSLEEAPSPYTEDAEEVPDTSNPYMGFPEIYTNTTEDSEEEPNQPDPENFHLGGIEPSDPSNAYQTGLEERYVEGMMDPKGAGPSPLELDDWN